MGGRPRLFTVPFAIVMAGSFGYFTSYAMLIPTLPRFVEGELMGSDVAVGVAVGAFAVTALLLRAWAGDLGDRRGRRILVRTGAALVTVSLLGMLLATQLPRGAAFVLIVGLRLVAGAGEAFFFVGAVSAINDLAPPERRGEAVSLFSVSLYAGVAVGPFVGESIMNTRGFESVWIVSGMLSAISLLFALAMADTRPETPPPPLRGMRRWLHPAGIFPGVVMFTSVFGFAGFTTFLPLYVDEAGFGGARLVLVMYGSILVAIRLFGARIPDVFGVERVGKLGLGLSASGLAIVGLWRSSTALFAGSAVFAVGQALAFPAFMALAAGKAPPAERGAAVGTTTAFIDLGFGLGPVMLGVVAAMFGKQRTFLGGGIVAVLGLALLVTTSRRRPSEATT